MRFAGYYWHFRRRRGGRLLPLAVAMAVIIASAIFGVVQAVPEPDTDENCAAWAAQGECEQNPGYMNVNCATSCQRVQQEKQQLESELKGINNFYDLSANDINGHVVEFNKYRGQVLVIANVASYCGYTDSHYRSLVNLYNQVPHDQVNILAFPCNQFGQQEPGSAQEIQEFAKSKYNVEFQMMEKIDVNGPNTHLVYKYLKFVTQQNFISWNFATYFVVGPDGLTITAHNNIEPLELKPLAMSLISNEEL